MVLHTGSDYAKKMKKLSGKAFQTWSGALYIPVEVGHQLSRLAQTPAFHPVCCQLPTLVTKQG